MFSQKEWSFAGASGREYRFAIRPKSRGLPESPGVFILAYTHPRGHLAGWQVNPLFIGQAENMRRALEEGLMSDGDQIPLWNSTFVLVESDRATRQACVRDLQRLGAEPLEP